MTRREPDQTALDRAVYWARMAERQVERDVGDYRAACDLASMWATVAQADAQALAIAGWANVALSVVLDD